MRSLTGEPKITVNRYSPNFRLIATHIDADGSFVR